MKNTDVHSSASFLFIKSAECKWKFKISKDTISTWNLKGYSSLLGLQDSYGIIFDWR